MQLNEKKKAMNTAEVKMKSKILKDLINYISKKYDLNKNEQKICDYSPVKEVTKIVEDIITDEISHPAKLYTKTTKFEQMFSRQHGKRNFKIK